MSRSRTGLRTQQGSPAQAAAADSLRPLAEAFLYLAPQAALRFACRVPAIRGDGQDGRR